MHRPLANQLGVGGLILVEATLRVPFELSAEEIRPLLSKLGTRIFHLYPGLSGNLFETFNYVTVSKGSDYRMVYGLDYFDFTHDRSKVLQEKVAVSCPADVTRFDVRELEQSSLSLALERTYDEGSDVSVVRMVNRVLVIRGVYENHEEGGSSRGRIEPLF